MARLHVALLGPLNVIVRDSIADGFAYDKVRALLVYLLLEGRRPLGRDALAALLWPDAPAGTARKGLRNALATLRQVIGDTAAEPAIIVTTRDTLQLHPQADLSVDVFELAALLAGVEQHAHPPSQVCEQCAERLAQAVVLYRGAFAEQIQVADSIAWEEWALLLRERLHAQVLGALAQLMGFHEARGEDDRARQYAWRALALEAWDEAAHRCLMRMYARAGQRSAAVAQYERCRKVLADELGIEPADETTKLYQQISARQIERERRPAAALRAAPTPSVPRPLTPLIGRERELAVLGNLLVQPNLRLLTLVGPPGVGKSRLALALAAAAETAFVSGCALVSLATVRDPDLVMAAIAKALDLRETADEPLAMVLAAYLRGKQLLLLLDNCEQVVSAATQIATLLQYAPGVMVLATSRVSLRISGEHEYRIAPLPYPNTPLPASREALIGAPAVELFIQRAAAVGLAADEGAALMAVGRLCARLDGLPLAIELAAAQCRYYSPAMLLGLLDQRMLRLDRGVADAAPHQRALESTIAWSVDLLSAEQQLLFQQIALFVGGCSLQGAAAVSGNSRQVALASDLTALLDHSLLQCEASSTGLRYTMLKPIQEHALALLLASPQADQVIDRFIAHSLTLVERATAELSGGDQPAGIDRLQQDYPNLVAALDWALSRAQAEAALRLAGALGWFWDLRGQMTEGRRWLAQALALPERVEPAIRARALASAGLLAIDQNDPAGAIALFQQALSLYGDSADASDHAYALCSLGRVYRIQGDYETAAAYFEQGLALARTAGDLPTIGYGHYNLGRIAYQRGAYADARARLLESIGAFEQTSNVWGLALAHCNLGRVAARQHELSEANAHLRTGLAHFTAINDLWGIALALCKLGWVACAQHEFEAARANFIESLAYAEQVSYHEGVADALLGLARAAQLGGHQDAMVMLLGAAGRFLDALSGSLNTLDRDEYDQALMSARATIDGAVFAAAWARGRDTPLELLLELIVPGSESRTVASA